MEKRIQKIKKFSLFLILWLFGSVYMEAQTPSIIQKIRFPLWAELDAYPELVNKENLTEDQFAYPISRIRQIAPFLINGMVYGWHFVYVPSDKARGVEEFLEITEIQKVDFSVNKIVYTSPFVTEERMNCWCEYTRDAAQIQNYYLWSSIQNKTIHGRGSGSIKKGFDGIKEASENAVKNAVREHFRAIIKNKPREISGDLLIRNLPTIGIVSGQYVINLDFFLESDRIKVYTQY